MRNNILHNIFSIADKRYELISNALIKGQKKEENSYFFSEYFVNEHYKDNILKTISLFK